MKNNIIIRPVKNEDAEQYIKLNNLVWRDAYKHIFPEEVFIDLDISTQKRIDSFPKYINNSENQMVYVAEDNGQIVGLINSIVKSKYKYYAENYAELCAIYIHPNYQNIGIGTQLKNIFYNWINEKGISKFVIGVLKDNHKARKVYEKWGGELDDYKQPFVKLGVEYEEVFYIFDLNKLNEKNMMNKKIGEGASSIVYKYNDDKVIVVGKRDDAFSSYRSLVEKFKKIENFITTINYPKIYQLISPCDEYLFGAMIEDLMQGTELESKILDLNLIEKKEIGKNLALFLNELHKIDVVGDKEEEIKINLAKFDKSINKLNEFIANDTKNKLEIIRNAYLELMKSKQFCITHGDLNQLNILITDDNKLSGIIDFGNMEYYIPEMEFVHMHSFDRTIYDSMIEHYYKEMNERDILLTELIMNIRHFKNIYNIEERKNMCLLNIERLISSYLD